MTGKERIKMDKLKNMLFMATVMNTIMDLHIFDETQRIDRNDADALIPVEETREIIQGVVAESAVLSRGRRLQNMTARQSKMKVLDLLPLAYFVNGEAGRKQLTKMAWDNKFIYAEEIAVIVPISEEVLDDADYDIWGEVRPRLIEAFGAKIDGAVLFNVDKPATWRNGIVATATAAGAVVTEGSVGKKHDTYDDIMAEGGLISLIESSGYDPNGYIADLSMRAKLRGLRNDNGDPIFKTDVQGTSRYTLDGAPMYFPKNGAYDKTQALMIGGDFSQLAYAIRQDITFKIFTEGVVQDPTTGDILYNLMQNDMVALRAVMRLGWEIPNPINALKPNKNQRCPFAILKGAGSNDEQDDGE